MKIEAAGSSETLIQSSIPCVVTHQTTIILILINHTEFYRIVYVIHIRFFCKKCEKDGVPLVFNYLSALDNKTPIGGLLCHLARIKNRKFILMLYVHESILTADKWYF